MRRDYMYTFPENLYTDVRLEDASVSEITYQNGELMQNLKRNHRGGFIRIFDGKRWYYSSTTDIDNIQEEINKLAIMANENKNIMDNLVVSKFEVNKGEFFQFKDNDILIVSQEEKLKL